MAFGVIWHVVFDVPHLFGTIRDWCQLCLVSDLGGCDGPFAVGYNRTGCADMAGKRLWTMR